MDRTVCAIHCWAFFHVALGLKLAHCVVWAK